MFEVLDGKFIHRGPLPSKELLKQPNGIAAFRDGTVYVTDFDLPPSRAGDLPHPVNVDPDKTANTLIAYTPPACGKGEGKWKVVGAGFNGCNGVAPGPEGRSLLVACWHSSTVWSIPRNPETGELWYHGTAKPLGLGLRFHPDNIKLTSPGHYEVCGQNSKIGPLLNFLLSLPSAPGGAMGFDWNGSDLSGIEDRTSALSGNRLGPSTAIVLGVNLYAGQPKDRNVYTVKFRSSRR
ncbi:MAG: hypothetical protein ABIT37_11770 [Luteolibacter sp.]